MKFSEMNVGNTFIKPAELYDNGVIFNMIAAREEINMFGTEAIIFTIEILSDSFNFQSESDGEIVTKEFFKGQKYSVSFAATQFRRTLAENVPIENVMVQYSPKGWGFVSPENYVFIEEKDRKKVTNSSINKGKNSQNKRGSQPF